MMEAAIEARELRYIYEDGTAALKGINLRAERGKITGILGANGAGKSTLMKQGGQVHPDEAAGGGPPAHQRGNSGGWTAP